MILGSERFQEFQIQKIFGAATGSFARNNILECRDRKFFVANATPLGRSKVSDAIRSVDQINIERTCFELDEITSVTNGPLQFSGQSKSELAQRPDDFSCVLLRLGQEKINVLGYSRIAEQDRAALSDEQVFHAFTIKCPGDLLGL